MFRKAQPGYLATFCLSLLLFCRSLPARTFETLPADNVQWSFAQPSRIVTVGDLHGDPAALLQILHNVRLISSDGRWIGGNAHLVVTGDLVDRGQRSLPLIRLAMSLEPLAEAAGGHMETLIGNHDMMIVEGHTQYSTTTERAEYAAYASTPAALRLVAEGVTQSRAQFQGAFLGDTDIARWMRRRNTVVRIGDTLFVHAGVGNWPATTDIGGINASVRAWIRHLQRAPGAVEPPAETRWVLDGSSRAHRTSGDSPFWMRELAGARTMPPDLEATLRAMGVRRVVFGHTPTRSRLIERRFGGLVYAIDTNISQQYSESSGGFLSALEIAGEQIPGVAPGVYRTGIITERNPIVRPSGSEPWITRCIDHLLAAAAP